MASEKNMKKRLGLLLFIAVVATVAIFAILQAIGTDIPASKATERLLFNLARGFKFDVSKHLLPYVSFITSNCDNIPRSLILTCIGIGAGLLIWLILKIIPPFKSSKYRRHQKENTPPSVSSLDQFLPELIGLSNVETFFLNLYRQQLGATRNAPGVKPSVPDKNRKNTRIYTLSIMHNGKWQSRHMSISTIGEDSRSKSQCFYVIFDTHMVVKIPPVPIKNFSDYIRRIRYESTLVTKLSPCVCIIPNISVILSRTLQSVGIGAIPARNEEEKCIRFLEAAPQYQPSLKIGGAFAFFMDLSQHYFLSYVLSELHDPEEEIRKTISSDIQVMHPGYDFETKYGVHNAMVLSDLQIVYDTFESGLSRNLLPAMGSWKPNEDLKRDWFIAHLINSPITAHAFLNLSASDLKKISEFLNTVAPRNGKIIKKYLAVVRDHATQVLFYRNRAKLSAIIYNLLSMLDILAEKSISIRDLKPDNLLVAGKPENYPLFLSSPDNFSIGLIDLETAMDYSPAGKRPLPQPNLGGTPAYATPSHFFANAILLEIYEDLSQILHIQDWHAMVGIIYETVIGTRLFVKTGCLIPSMIQTLKKIRANSQISIEEYQKLNGVFWKTAREDFKNKIKESEFRLNKIIVEVPMTLKISLKNFLDTTSTTGHFLDRNKTISERLATYPFTLSVKALLEIMFEIVFETMNGKPDYAIEHDDGQTVIPALSQPTQLLPQSLGYSLTGPPPSKLKPHGK